ncbi:MAG: hypothetical protein KJZ86_06495 [Caldilineaceae bacterium]|nr:hypothetical protein [Caldilineaceae bacterium]HRJ40565.1 hypothetical protein [Caldilineaceae bacterium]
MHPIRVLLVLTGAGSPAALRTALDAGVRSYLHKESVTSERLLCPLQGLCNGLVVLDPAALPL